MTSNNDQIKSDFAAGLHVLIDNLQPLIEMAEGQRAAMEARGWSPSASEAYASQLLAHMLEQVFKAAK